MNSVHEANWQNKLFNISDSEILKWKNLFKLREILLPELEKARQSKTIGKSLDAKILVKSGEHSDIYASLSFARSCEKEFQELLNISQFETEVWPDDPEFEIQVSKADGQKCERCWHWETDIGKNSEHPTICGRCVEAVIK